MKRSIPTLVLSISAAFISNLAMAAPHDPAPHHPATQHQPMKQHQPAKPVQKKVLQPRYDWKAGHRIPAQYQAKNYQVNYKQSAKLNKPGKNQQWIKVNGDYVLINTQNYKVLKVVS